ncbi:MAG: hypothetical protein WDZ40_00575 [Candidatus Spechtbacterales bacterium]
MDGDFVSLYGGLTPNRQKSGKESSLYLIHTRYRLAGSTLGEESAISLLIKPQLPKVSAQGSASLTFPFAGKSD